MLEVGIGSRNYGYRRVSYGLPVEDTHFRKVLYAPWKFLWRRNPKWQNTYLFRPFAPVDLYHLWNGTALTSKPWISSFEADLPRHGGATKGWLYDLCLRQLHRSNCCRLLPLSDAARCCFLARNKGVLEDSVIAKTEVFVGGVPVDEGAVAAHRRFLENSRDGFVLCLVGHEFFRKGGVPVLRAYQRLKDSLAGLRLVVISQLVAGDYVTFADEADREAATRALQSEPGIEWHAHVPGAKVLDLLAHSHVGLLPTLDDSLGWTVLEAMSVGLPVITTNIRAMPEMVTHGVNGYRIELPLEQQRRWQALTLPPRSLARAEALRHAYEVIADGVAAFVRGLYDNRNDLDRMGANALNYVRRAHDPGTQARRLRRIYEDVVGRDFPEITGQGTPP
jgi:glycosyltransferase involved in cell wall biosynthesis